MIQMPNLDDMKPQHEDSKDDDFDECAFSVFCRITIPKIMHHEALQISKIII